MTIITSLSQKTVSAEITNLTLDITNNGIGTAYHVEVIPIDTDFFSFNNLSNIDSLEPNETAKINLTIEPKNEILPGKYPLVLDIKYFDNQQNSYSVYRSHILTYEKGYESNIEGYIENKELIDNKSTKMNLVINNLDNKLHYVKIKLYLPVELNYTLPTSILSLDFLSKRTVEFDVYDNGATAGDVYNIIGSLEYEDENYHYTTFVQGNIIVVEGKEPKEPILLYLLIGIFTILLLIYIYYLKSEGNK